MPKTAPLATPEHDTSLLDVNSVENLEMDSSNNNMSNGSRLQAQAQAQQVQQQQSLEGFNNDIFSDHMDQVLEVMMAKHSGIFQGFLGIY